MGKISDMDKFCAYSERVTDGETTKNSKAGAANVK